MITELLTWSKALLIILALASNYVCANYVVDDSVGLGRMFNGIGGLSGGGVSDTIYASNFCQFILSAVIYIYIFNKQPMEDFYKISFRAGAYPFICI